MSKEIKNVNLKEASTAMIVIVGILLSLFLLSQVIGEVISWNNTEQYPSKTITVNGEGEALAVPDIATFTFSVTERGDTTEDAQRLATSKINSAIDFLKSEGVDDKDIKTQNYNVYPQYNYNRICNEIQCDPSTPEIVGYEVSQSVSVKVREQEDAGRFLTELGSIGISNVSGLQFTIDDDSVLYEEAREKAIVDAKEKAKRLAQTLGVKLKGVVSFGEERDGQENYGYGMGSTVRTMAESISPKLPQGENSYTSRVWITYEIK